MEKNDYVPQTLDKAVDYLVENCPPDELETLKQMGERAFVGKTHHVLGRWLRNNWGLWKEDSDLSKHFQEIGIYHADDMSGIILTCFFRKVNGIDLNLEKQVKKYIEFWKKEGYPDGNPTKK